MALKSIDFFAGIYYDDQLKIELRLVLDDPWKINRC